MDDAKKKILLSLILRATRSKPRFLCNLFLLEENSMVEFHRLVQELKLGLCCKDKSIYVPPQ